MTNFSEEFSATHQALSDVRQHVGSWLRDQGEESPILIGDVEMVLTELGANVVDHTPSTSIRVAVELPGDRITIEVANNGSAEAVPAVEDWGQLSEGTRGRGLRIIRALCTSVVVSGDATHTQIRCDIATGDELYE